MVFQKGHKFIGGRKKGSTKKNKLATFRSMWLEVFHSEEMGGVQGLKNWASKDEKNKKIFYELGAKLMPKNMDDEIKTKGSIKLVMNLQGQNGDNNEDQIRCSSDFNSASPE